MNNSIKVSKRGKALVLTISRPLHDNRFDESTLRDLTSQVSSIQEDTSIRALVISGEGSIFCAGGHVGQTEHERESFGIAFKELMAKFDKCKVPVLAAINGRCSAGGMSLLEAADFAISVDDAKFGYPEILAGAFPLLALVTIPTHLPKKVFFDLAYSGRMLNAQEAKELGLINAIVTAKELWLEIDRFIESLTQKSEAAITRGRHLYYGELAPTRIDALIAAGKALKDATPIQLKSSE